LKDVRIFAPEPRDEYAYLSQSNWEPIVGPIHERFDCSDFGNGCRNGTDRK